MKLSLAIETAEVLRRLPVALLSGTFQEKLAKASLWGADGVELMTTSPGMLNHSEIRDSLKEYHLLPSAVASGGIAFATGRTLLHSDPAIAEEAYKKLLEMVNLAEAIGAPMVTIGSFRGRLANVTGDGKTLLRQVLGNGAEYASQHGIKLVVEPINRFETDFLHNANEALEFITNVAHPNLGLLLDTFHMNIEESSWKEPFEKAMKAGKLWHIHIGENHRLPPGQGMIPFREIVMILKELNYQGFLSAELLGKPDPDTAGRFTIDTMRKIMEME